MPRKPRVLYSGAYYHIFNRGVAKRQTFLDHVDRMTFLSLLGRYAEELHVEIFAYCLMENHYHLFLKILKPNLSKMMQQIMSQYTHQFNLRHDRVGPLFQGRYKCRLVDADVYAKTLLRYIHLNPLEAGIVNRLTDYPWSSYLVYMGELHNGKWLKKEKMLKLFHSNESVAVEQFSKYHTQPILSRTDREVAQLSKAALTKNI